MSRYPYNGKTNASGRIDIGETSSEELENLRKRALRLDLAELDELIRYVGVSFATPPGEEYLPDRESYVELLDEADDLRKVYEYLDDHEA
jgi:hypothetical protein